MKFLVVRMFLGAFFQVDWPNGRTGARFCFFNCGWGSLVLEGTNVTGISPYLGGPYIVGERKIYFYANLYDFVANQYG